MYKLHKMRIVVIGAGIIGVTSAVELSKLGHEVTLVDQLEDVCLGTSAENTGHLISSPLSKLTLPTRIHFPLIFNRKFWTFIYEYISTPATHITPKWDVTRIDSKVFAKQLLKTQNIKTLFNTQVTGFYISSTSPKVESVETTKGSLNTDGVVIAAGIESANLFEILGAQDKLPLLPVRGYSLTIEAYKRKANLEGKVIWTNGHIHGTIFESGKTRVSGYADVGTTHEHSRCRTLQEHAKRMFPLQHWHNAKCWSGVRPLTPTFAPYIQRVKPFKNVWTNTGHGFWGTMRSVWSAKRLGNLIDK